MIRAHGRALLRLLSCISGSGGGVDIVGATTGTHEVVGDDMSSEIGCVVTAQNDAGDASEPAPVVTSVWRPVLLILAAAGGGHLWVHTEGISVANEQPVVAWFDVRGVRQWEQPGASSLRPTRKAGGLLFDGIDDRLNGDATITSWLSPSSGPYTMGLGVVTALSNATTVYWSATSGSTSSIVNLNTQNVLGRAGGSTLFSTAIVDTGPLSTWITVAGAGSNLAKRRVSTSEALGSYGTQLAGIINSTLGARRTASPSLFLNGTVAWVVSGPAALSSVDMAAIEAVMTAQGMPT